MANNLFVVDVQATIARLTADKCNLSESGAADEPAQVEHAGYLWTRHVTYSKTAAGWERFLLFFATLFKIINDAFSCGSIYTDNGSDIRYNWQLALEGKIVYVLYIKAEELPTHSLTPPTFRTCGLVPGQTKAPEKQTPTYQYRALPIPPTTASVKYRKPLLAPKVSTLSFKGFCGSDFSNQKLRLKSTPRIEKKDADAPAIFKIFNTSFQSRNFAAASTEESLADDDPLAEWDWNDPPLADTTPTTKQFIANESKTSNEAQQKDTKTILEEDSTLPHADPKPLEKPVNLRELLKLRRQNLEGDSDSSSEDDF